MKDTRVSRDLLLEALANGLNQSGQELVNVRHLPNPIYTIPN